MNMQKIRIVVASDLSGFLLKKSITSYLSEKEDIEVIDYGIPSEDQPSPYYEQAIKAARAIQQGIADKGILICGTGQGMAIVANKHRGIYACVVNDVFSGERAKIINNANVITLGGWITAPFHAKEIVASWLHMSFAQKMEFKKDFLENAFQQVKELEKKNFR
jgi:ribose 5-phosphate isomerase B